MAIGLNYSQFYYMDGVSLLPNYLYLLDNDDDITIHDKKHIRKHVDDAKLLTMLQDEYNDIAFEHPLIRKILLEAYPYEVLMKFAGQDISNDNPRNKRIIGLFNDFFGVDYDKELERYCAECNRESLQKTFLAHEKGRYKNINDATKLFFDFVDKLLQDQGMEDHANKLQVFIQNNLFLSYKPGISGNAEPDGQSINVEVGNDTYTTLFHEMIHVVNRYFRYIYEGKNHHVCDDNLTKSNEGLSNFVAYHLMDVIIAGDIDMIDEMSLEPIFFSMYIDIYATMREHGTNNRNKNFDIIYQELKKFEGDLLTDEKAKFYYERFYKFFHYDQHEYFYPKEMMYYLGYNGILELFRNSNNKKQLLANCLLGKVCL